MNLPLFLLVVSIVLFILSAALSFIKRDNYRLQLINLVVMTFSTGVFISIFSSMQNYNLLIWPAIFLIRIFSMMMELYRKLPAQTQPPA